MEGPRTRGRWGESGGPALVGIVAARGLAWGPESGEPARKVPSKLHMAEET